ncbi:N-acetyl-alpha-D-glucosaminyl L-malate synthase BshA [Vulgatibacter sp.]|uniref:N-acetyl-alpha-D-glucosaminyl L-malate synthase BshA n=1 Tax=Vulgatibacter sp. TaxID=1971226 RepID=UPI00356977BA
MKFSIGIVCFPSFGGSGVVASELARGLAERGHDAHLLSTARPGRITGDEPGLTFHEIRVPDYPLFEHAPYGLAVASKIVDVCRAHRLDLLQVHYAVPHVASGLLAKQLLGVQAPLLVTSLHGTDVTRTGSDPSYRSITSAAIAASDGVTVPSAWLRDEARARLQLPGDLPIEVIANFVDSERFAPPQVRDRARLQSLFPRAEEGPVLFHVSNFRPVKRTGDLIEVLALLRHHLPARLVLVGDGPDRPLVEERAKALGLDGQIHFLGKQASFVEWLRHADAFLLPSECESFGVAALEALAAGVPVFGYRVGGLPEVVPAEVGRLVEPFDAKALANAVRAALETPGASERLGSAARTHVLERYRREPALDRYERYFRELLLRRPPEKR